MAREKGAKRIGPFAVPKAMSSGPSATLSTWFKIKGLNYSITSACATSTHCIGAAAEQIQLGKQDVIFAGGCEELDWTLSMLFDAMGAMSSRLQRHAPPWRAAPTTPTATASSSPAAPGWWCWRSSSAPRRAARRSTARSSAMRPTPTASTWWRRRAKARRAACGWRSRRPAGARIDYLNPHGTGTEVGDLREMEAVREVFGDAPPLISSTKSLTGHSLGAAGAQEAIYCLLMMRDGFVAESANIDNLDPAFADLPILRERKDMALETVMSNSFGFGGTNGCLVMSRLDA